MAEVDTGGGGGGHGKHQKKRAKKLSTRIDMTPMVDLGFLLLTFFMLTTTFSKPKVIGLTPPVKSDKKTQVDTTTITVILSGHDKIYYYYGILAHTTDSNNIALTNFSDKGIRKIVLNRNTFVLDQLKPLDTKHENKQIGDTLYDNLKDTIQRKKQALFVIIKADSVAKWVNVVTMLDEMDICDVGKYSLLDATPGEIDMVKDFNRKNNIQ